MKISIQRNNAAYLAAGIIAGIILTAQLAFRPGDEKKTTGRNDNNTHTWFVPQLPTNITFSGEVVPLDKWDVKERLDRQVLFNYYQPSNVLYMLKLSNRYFPAIVERLKANGVPEDFKYLCVAESNLVAEAISRSGAVSWWQFLDMTAPGYDLEVNKEVDQRYDVLKATDAACKYLKSAYAKFGSWTAAAASYNCGQGGFNANATFQKSKNYYDLMLPEETNRYIFRILAFKYLMENAAEFGFQLEKDEAYQPINTRNITVITSIPDLAAFAIQENTNYKILRLLNPWLRGRSLTVKPGKSYTIQLPQ
ncbi:MAG TPA: lytic transglycosylase domain-containing protein [Chitinophagaceae bacterium]